MKPEVICTQIVTSGADMNIVMACLLGLIACIVAMAYLHPGFGHWIALRIAAHAEYVRVCRQAGMQAKQEFLELNAPQQELRGLTAQELLSRLDEE